MGSIEKGEKEKKSTPDLDDVQREGDSITSKEEVTIDSENTNPEEAPNCVEDNKEVEEIIVKDELQEAALETEQETMKTSECEESKYDNSEKSDITDAKEASEEAGENDKSVIMDRDEEERESPKITVISTIDMDKPTMNGIHIDDDNETPTVNGRKFIEVTKEFHDISISDTESELNTTNEDAGTDKERAVSDAEE